MNDLLGALQHVHELYPDVAVQCFRATGDVALPSWIDRLDYLTKDQLVAFYNRCSIFVLPSHYEGWGLPAAEAMACGAAVVTTDSGGPRDFAENETTALVVPPGDIPALAAAMVRLLEDNQLRCQLADAGVRRLSMMTWERAAESIEAVLTQLVPDHRTVAAIP
jgi:glycosyltransferase involved in cell wall biosynthesis